MHPLLHLKFRRGSILIIIAIIVMAIILLFTIVFAAAMIGDRTGLGSGTTNPGGTATGPGTTAPTPPTTGSGECLSVPAIKQNGPSWCARGTAQMVVAFYKPSIGTNPTWQNSHMEGGMNLGLLNSYLSGTGVTYSNRGCGASALNGAISAINSGKPVIYYSTYGGQAMHFFVLTGYDATTKVFSGNDPWSGGGCISTILRHALTYSNLSSSTDCKHIDY